MLMQNEEKKMLIESMKKLTGHVTGNPQRQKDIFEALSLHDFNKIVSNLKDDNEYLRRISALFLCELFYRNPETKAGAVTLLGLQPKWGRVKTSRVRFVWVGYLRALASTDRPQKVRRRQMRMYRVDAKRSSRRYLRSQLEEEQKICWVINLERKTLKIQFLDYKKYSSFTFMDPSKHIFGFSISQPGTEIKASNIPQKSPERIIDSNQKRYLVGSHKIEEKMLKGSLDHFQGRQRSKQRVIPSKYSLNMTVNYLPERKTSASSQNQGPVSYKNQLVTTHSSKKQEKTTRPITSDSVRQTKPSWKHSLNISPKISLTEGESHLNSSRQPFQYQEISTDRTSPSRRYTNTAPSSAREGFREQDRFYKRVKDIIHK